MEYIIETHSALHKSHRHRPAEYLAYMHILSAFVLHRMSNKSCGRKAVAVSATTHGTPSRYAPSRHHGAIAGGRSHDGPSLLDLLAAVAVAKASLFAPDELAGTIRLNDLAGVFTIIRPAWHGRDREVGARDQVGRKRSAAQCRLAALHGGCG
jgi:hypothetical protein